MSRKTIPIALPFFDDAELDAVQRPLRSGWVTQGPEVAAFEHEFAKQVGATHACAVSSATTALHLALLAVGVEPGDEVITVSHSFIATANAIRYCGALPVFVDIDPATFNISPDALEQAFGPRTKAVLCVHQMGMPCDLSRILERTRAHGVPLIEDAACASGSQIELEGRWQPIGAPHGEIACFSFHPRKVITTGDGGMLTFRDKAIAERVMRLRVHGMDRAPKPGAFEPGFSELGFNYRLTDLQAAVGRTQLAKLEMLVERRRALAARYGELLSDLPGVVAPHEPSWARSNYQSYCVRLPDSASQSQVMARMLDSGVSTRRGILCSHREAAYPKGTWRCVDARCDAVAGRCPHLAESERAQDRCVSLPLFHTLTDDEQAQVVQALKSALRAS